MPVNLVTLWFGLTNITRAGFRRNPVAELGNPYLSGASRPSESTSMCSAYIEESEDEPGYWARYADPMDAIQPSGVANRQLQSRLLGGEFCSLFPQPTPHGPKTARCSLDRHLMPVLPGESNPDVLWVQTFGITRRIAGLVDESIRYDVLIQVISYTCHRVQHIGSLDRQIY